MEAEQGNRGIVEPGYLKLPSIRFPNDLNPARAQCRCEIAPECTQLLYARGDVVLQIEIDDMPVHFAAID